MSLRGVRFYRESFFPWSATPIGLSKELACFLRLIFFCAYHAVVIPESPREGADAVWPAASFLLT